MVIVATSQFWEIYKGKVISPKVAVHLDCTMKTDVARVY